MAYTRPQAAPAVTNGSGTSVAKAYTSSVTAHSLLIAFATTNASSSFTFSSTGSPTWSKIAPFNDAGSGQWISIGYCLDAPAGATTVTCTFGATGAFTGLIIGEYAAPGNVASVLDANTAGRSNATSTGPSDASLAAAAGDLVVSYIISAASTTITAGSGFTIIQNDTTDVAAAEDNLSASGTLSPAFTFSPTAASGIMSAAFKAAGAAAAVPPSLVMAPRWN